MINVALMGKERGYETIILNPNGNYWFDNQSWVSLSLFTYTYISVSY